MDPKDLSWFWRFAEIAAKEMARDPGWELEAELAAQDAAGLLRPYDWSLDGD